MELGTTRPKTVYTLIDSRRSTKSIYSQNGNEFFKHQKGVIDHNIL